jgi:tetratricopeptide (TPR) repeat protein
MRTTDRNGSAEWVGQSLWRSGVSGTILIVLLGAACAVAQDAAPKTPVSPEQQQIQALTEKMMLAGMAGRNAEALEVCDSLIKLHPQNGDNYCARGNWLRCLGRKDEAMAAFDKAIALTTNTIIRADGMRSKGELLADKGKYDDAIALYTKAIEALPAKQSPDDVAVPWFRRAEARAMAGDATNALADLKKAIELWPDRIGGEAKKSTALKSLRENAEFKRLTK